MIESFIKQIPQNSKIAIWGYGFCGQEIYKKIKLNRKDVSLVFIVDSFNKSCELGLEVVSPRFLGDKKAEFDLLLVCTTNRLNEHLVMLDYLDIKFLSVSYELEQYCRKLAKFALLESKINEVCKLLSEDEQELYRKIWDCRWKVSNEIEEYAKKNYGIRVCEPVRNYSIQYMEFINKDVIKTLIDGGAYNGAHLFAFKKYLKNLTKVYSFEPLYDTFKSEIFDFYFKKFSELEFIPLGLWDKEEVLEFYNNDTGSRIVTGRKDADLIKIKTISIDEYKKQNNLPKIDFIKLDIEGAELKCLQGAEETLLNDRPQLAISIYHSDSDMVEIPLYLAKLLKDYTFHLAHYSAIQYETVFYAIPNELCR